MEIRKIPIEKLNPAAYNPRKDLKPGDPEYEKLKRSIQEFGYVEPIVWNKRSGNIVGGHQRYKVLRDMGMSEVDCVVVDLDATKEKALNLALNKIQGDWDYEKLKDLLQELDTGEFDIELTGFDMDEIEDLIAQLHVPEEIVEDEVPEPPEEAITKPGDLWLLGRHRLLCGDATVAEDVERLMDGKKADMVFTDPPYNIGYDYWDYLDNKEAGEYKKWCEQWFRILVKHSPIILITIGQWNMKMWFDIEKPLGIIAWIARNKTSGSKISLFSVWEPILVYAKKIKKLKRNKADVVEGLLVRDEEEFVHDVNKAIEYVKNNCDLVEINNKRQTDVELHKCPKQVRLLKELLLRYSSRHALILDVFGGSGTTLIAAEQLSRTCYMMELDPVYCDVIVQRYINLKGHDGDVYLERDGNKIAFSNVT
jgi:ParB-like chromosome segregation protein Spo0J